MGANMAKNLEGGPFGTILNGGGVVVFTQSPLPKDATVLYYIELLH